MLVKNINFTHNLTVIHQNNNLNHLAAIKFFLVLQLQLNVLFTCQITYYVNHSLINDLHFKDPAIITIETVSKLTTVNMLLRIVDSFTPLDRIPVERNQKITTPFKLPLTKAC
jgi:hypothetical protein